MAIIGGACGWTTIITSDPEDGEDERVLPESELREFKEDWEKVRQAEKEMIEIKRNRIKK